MPAPTFPRRKRNVVRLGEVEWDETSGVDHPANEEEGWAIIKAKYSRSADMPPTATPTRRKTVKPTQRRATAKTKKKIVKRSPTVAALMKFLKKEGLEFKKNEEFFSQLTTLDVTDAPPEVQDAVGLLIGWMQEMGFGAPRPDAPSDELEPMDDEELLNQEEEEETPIEELEPEEIVDEIIEPGDMLEIPVEELPDELIEEILSEVSEPADAIVPESEAELEDEIMGQEDEEDEDEEDEAVAAVRRQSLMNSLLARVRAMARSRKQEEDELEDEEDDEELLNAAQKAIAANWPRFMNSMDKILSHKTASPTQKKKAAFKLLKSLEAVTTNTVEKVRKNQKKAA